MERWVLASYQQQCCLRVGFPLHWVEYTALKGSSSASSVVNTRRNVTLDLRGVAQSSDPFLEAVFQRLVWRIGAVDRSVSITLIETGGVPYFKVLHPFMLFVTSARYGVSGCDSLLQ